MEVGRCCEVLVSDEGQVIVVGLKDRLILIGWLWCYGLLCACDMLVFTMLSHIVIILSLLLPSSRSGV